MPAFSQTRVTSPQSQGQGRGGDNAPGAPVAPAPPAAPLAPVPIPRGGGRVVVDKQGDRTNVTFTEVPPSFVALARRAEQTAFGVLGILAAIVILGPFARMWARRIEKRGDMNNAFGGAGNNAQLLQQQLLMLQQSVDAMSVEVERISESQRFQSKLMNDKQRLGS